jgi:hypothetical protein
MDNARELALRLLDLLRREQSAMADFLVALADFDRRRAWAELGYTSLFHFLHRELGMSKGAAHYRKTAAELIQRVPELVEPLRDGRICVTSVIELAKVLTPENRQEVLPRFFNLSRQEAKAVSAELCPAEAAPHRTVVTTMTLAMPARMEAIPARVEAVPATAVLVQPVELPLVERPSAWLPGSAAAARVQLAPVSFQPAVPRAVAEPDETPPPQASTSRPLPALNVPASPRTAIEPLTADLRRLHVTVSKRFIQKLEAARDALSHSHPGGDAEEILEAGLDLLIARAAKRRGIVAKPRSGKPPPHPSLSPGGGEGRESLGAPAPPGGGEGMNPRAIPARVRREVWLRDGGRCQFRLENGTLCGSTHRLQFDHVRPVALAGEPTPSNLRLACAPHNLLAARRVFGDALMDRYAPARTAGTPSEPR